MIRPLYGALQMEQDVDAIDVNNDRDQDVCFFATDATTGGVVDEDPKADYVYFGVDDAYYGKAELNVEHGNSYCHKTAVIQRETDLLTPEELNQHADLAAATMLEELKVWEGPGCFRRQWKRYAYNVMDSRFVAK